jgi:hypothetical protein
MENSNERNQVFRMTKKMLNLEQTDSLEESLKAMLIDACKMTESCGGIFLSRQAIAAILVCWSRIYNM